MVRIASSTHLPVLADVVDYRPLTVSPQDRLTTVLSLLEPTEWFCALTCQVAAGSPLVSSLSADSLEFSTAACVIVVDQAAVVGILTQHDLVHLGAIQADLATLQVEAVMTRSPVTITLSPQQSLLHALLLLKQHRIHHLPVLNTLNQLVGIVTAESLYQALQAKHFWQWQRVAEIMTANVVQMLPTASLLAVAQQMDSHQVSCVVVTSNQTATAQVPLGLITEGDLVQCLRLGCDFAKTDAQTLMSSPPFCTAPTTSLWAAHQQMQRRRIRQLLVCDTQRRLLGIVTQTDVLQSLEPDELLETIQALQQTIDQQNATLQAMTLDLQRQNAQQQQLKAQLQQAEAALAQGLAEHQQTEQALRQSEERWQLVLKGNQDGIWDLDLVTGEVFRSLRFWQILGYSQPPAETDNQAWLARIHPNDFDRVLQINQDYLQQRQPHYAVEYRLRCQDGSYCWVLGRGQAIWDAAGQPVRFVGSITDMSDRKQSEERYRQLAEKLQLITANAPVYIYEIDRNGYLTFVNHVYANFTLDQVLGTRLKDWFPAEQQPMIEQTLTQVFQTQQIQAIAYEIPDPQGEIHAYEAQIAPILIDNEVSSVVLIASDVTQRKQTEARLKEQAALIDIATDAILVRSLDDKVIFWSKGAERIYGWSAAAVLGKTLSQLLDPKPAPELAQAWKTVLAQGEWQGELQKSNQAGTELTIESRWTLVRNEAGEPDSILSVDTDITEKRQLEVQFLRAQRLESLGTLAGGIAHDLNNLMTPILGIAHLLSILLKDSDEKVQELLEIQLSSVRRGTALVKQILAFARGVEGKRTVLQLRHVINEVKAFTTKTFPKSISIQTDLARDLWPIQGDATHLHQVLMNLCVNARDAMPEGGSLLLSAENDWFEDGQAQRLLEARPGPYIVVTIADTGMGIAPDVVDRIFEPFFTTKPPGKGTGLGLSTVIGIVKSHGGFVTVSSQMGQGTQFKVYLPAIATTPTPSEVEPQPLPPGRGELILVVDDEASICKTAKTMLEAYQYRVMTTTTGTEAIALYRQHQAEISAILIDLMMPDPDGFAVIRALQQIQPPVKVIAVSGLATNQAKLKLDGPAVDAFLAKPYNLDDLLHALNRVLHSSTSA